MTLRVEQFGDVCRVRMTSVGGRLAGIDVSAYVVRGVMVDTGFHRVHDELASAARALGVNGVIVTHWHEDHAGNVAALARRGMPIRIAADTELMLRQIRNLVPEYRPADEVNAEVSATLANR